jgi:hypothetical protein
MAQKLISPHQLVAFCKKEKIHISGEITNTLNLPSRKRERLADLHIHLDKKNPRPKIWIKLATMVFQPGTKVRIQGTRIISGNGAIDGLLLPPYEAALKTVNAKREKLGLPPIKN